MKLNIRNKLILFASLLVFVPISLSALAIIYQVKKSSEYNAKSSIERDARIAERIYNNKKQFVKEIAQTLARTIATNNLIDSVQIPVNPVSLYGNAAKTAKENQEKGKRQLEELLKNRLNEVDFVIVTDMSGKILLRHNGSPAPDKPEIIHNNPVLLNTLNKFETRLPDGFSNITQVSFVEENLETLKILGLDNQARIKTSDGKTVSSGLALEGVSLVSAGESNLGFVIVGLLANNAKQERSIVDEIKRTLYTDIPTYGGACVIFQKTIITTNLPTGTSNTIGLQTDNNFLDKLVAKTQKIQGTNFKIAYVPIKNIDSKIIGWLGVGVKENYFTALVNRVLITIIAITGLFLIMASGIAIYTAKQMTQPLIELTQAANKISLGELEEPISLTRSDEIGQLAEAFERMRVSLKQAIERLRRR